MQKLFAIVAAAALFGGCDFQSVDIDQPVAVADKFYGALKNGDGKTALAQFSPAFKAKETEWPRLLENMQRTYGPVTSVTLQNSSLASNGEDPCYLLTYAVQRRSLASTETLFLCARANVPPWLISGHSLTRADNHQSIAGGMLPSEIGVHVP
ncbi:MAG: hypothetical protein E6Q50_01430 [Lysobacter sp.]|nr:MAG: hypothetical protein E6Q50_01430 [Lysobacter sp.]